MGRKKILERKLQRALEKQKKLQLRADASNDVNDLRGISELLDDLDETIQDIRDEIEAEGEDGAGDGAGDGVGDNGSRGNEPAGGSVQRGLDARGMNAAAGVTVATFTQRGLDTTMATRGNEMVDILDSVEYRQTFANYVRTGKWEPVEGLQERAAEMVTVADIGKVIPNTIMQEVIKNLKSYGTLYNRVRKLNIQGGVEFPIEDLVPTVRWITETTVSEEQKAPELKVSVKFAYHIAEAKIAQSLLANVVSLPVLESEIARVLAEAFIKDDELKIVSGSGVGQPLGILNDTRVEVEHKITFAPTEMANWKTWRKKLFAKIPLAYRGEGVMLMTSATWEAEIMTLADENNRPVYSETYDPATGTQILRFNGREVILVEADVLTDYATAIEGEVFAIYLKPTDYAINSNLQIGFKRYFNDDTNKWINKGLTIKDGKLLDVNGVYILKKTLVEPV